MTKNYRDARYTTAADAAERPGETVAETVHRQALDGGAES